MSKGISIDYLVDTINGYLERSAEDDRAGRMATSFLLEQILFEHNVYDGFDYLTKEAEWRDDSRRRYRKHKNLD